MPATSAKGGAEPPLTALLAGGIFASATLIRRTYEREQRSLLQQTAQEEKRLQRRLRHLQTDLARADSAERLRSEAGAILASLHLLRRGQEWAEIPDPACDEVLRIKLDPARSPSANADALFRRARKAADSRRHVEQRMSDAEAQLRALGHRRERIEAATSPEEIEAFVSRVATTTNTGRRPQDAKAKRKKREVLRPSEEDPRWRRYLLPGDWVVLAARNARDNDLLTQRVAHLSDLWFHARGCPGSHVVLRCAQRKEQPPKAILEATAAIAAYHSKARNSGLVPVAYAPKRYVRKPKGAKAGLVFMNREVVVFVKPRLPDGYRH
jgi:predicted ribosome quality control (RQC) complex YloA/Tae2 family protein